MKILIIEDESAVREGLVDNLMLEGYQVIWRDNAWMVLRHLNKRLLI